MSLWNALRSLAFFLFLVPQVSIAITLATPDEDRRAKQALPPQGKALLYVYRGGTGARVSPTLLLNGKELGALEPRTFYMLPVKPGRVDLRAGSGQVLSLRVQEGRVYFVQLTVDGGGDGSLAQTSYGRGRQDVHMARLARSGQPTAVARRETPRQEADTVRNGRAGFNLILKGGSFSLASGSQSILTVPMNITTGSTTLGLEGEWISGDGWAFGAEYLSHQHSYTATVGNGDISASTVTINVKKYFRYGATVQPYVGAGLGSALAQLSGGITGSAGGLAAQVMGGVAVRGENLGLYTELKYQSASAKDSNGEGIDTGGMGVFAGVSLLF